MRSAAMAGLGAVLAAARYLAFLGIVRLTVRLMRRMASDAFWRVQRFSTDWHANNFAGSIVRRITRGIWAVDMLDDTLLLALLPALLVLIGCPLLLGWRWPGMGLLVAAGALVYVSISVALSLGWIAPAARLSNAQDTRLGGSLSRLHYVQHGGEVLRRRGARGCAAGDRAGQVGRSHAADVDVRVEQRPGADGRRCSRCARWWSGAPSGCGGAAARRRATSRSCSPATSSCTAICATRASTLRTCSAA